MRTRRSVPLLVAVFAVAAGLLGMHTLGHLSDQPMPMRAPASTIAGAAHHTATDVGDLLAPLTGQVTTVAGSHHGHGMPVEVAALCLAVLAAGTLIIGLLLLRGQGRGADRTSGVRRVLVATVRGPPRVRLGLRLAALSVLRN